MGLALTYVILTIVPAADRPETGLQHDVEHFGAFSLARHAARFRILSRSKVHAVRFNSIRRLH